MANKFQTGDVVELQSGGEPMTVVVSNVAFTTVTWHSKIGSNTETYPTPCLRLCDLA